MTPHPALLAKNLAVIVGGTRGFGLVAAKAFVSRFGMHVAIGDDDSEEVKEAIKAIQSETKDVTVKVWGTKVDVSNDESVESFKDQILVHFENVHLTILIAHTFVSSTYKNGEWDKEKEIEMASKVLGSITVNLTFLPLIKSHKQPSLIINMVTRHGITHPRTIGPSHTNANNAISVLDLFTSSLAARLSKDQEGRQIRGPFAILPGRLWAGRTGRRYVVGIPEPEFTPEEWLDSILKQLEGPELHFLRSPTFVERGI